MADSSVRDVVGLVAAAQAGDDDALGELVSTHLALVYSIVGHALRGHADVDDVVQETMISVMRGLPGLREPDRFRAWTVAIAHRQVQLHLRDRRKARLRREEIPVELPDASGDFAERTVTDLLLRAQRRELTEAARWLDDDDQRLLSLLWRETLGDVSRTEVAAALRVSPKLAGLRLRRMKAQLEAVRAVVRALQTSPRCPDLAGVVHSWDGVASPVWRKRLVRHIRGCRRCGLHRRGLVAPEKLLLGIVALPVAAGYTAQAPAASTVWSFVTLKMAAGAAAVTVAAGGSFVYAVHETPAPREESVAVGSPTTAPAPAVSPAASSAGAPSVAASAAPAPSAGVPTADIVVAPNGSDSGAGTLQRPYATIGKAVEAVRPGQTIALRGGTYQPTASVVIGTSGEATRRITLSNYRNERPVIDASRVPPDQWTIIHEANYWTVQGLEIKNSGSHAYVCVSCQFNVLQRLSIHDNVRSALTLRDPGTIGNQILDSDFFNNYDPDENGRAGIGLGIGNGSGDGNVVRGNRAFNNADNGFDVGDFASPVTLEHNWAYGNGVNRWGADPWQSNADGFHLGGGNPVPAAAHVLRHNAAWDNDSHGFSSSANRGAIELTNNTAFRNVVDGFYLWDSVGPVTANAALENGSAPATVREGTPQSGNTWQGGAVQFRSTDPRPAQGPRGAGGALPRVDFLVTGNGVGASMAGPTR
jgi:RNA polymerase sigma factor (sigma-70 family)